MRQFLRQWRFNTVLILMLGAGVGATTTMLGLVDVFFFRDPPHVADPGRLMSVRAFRYYPDYLRLRDGLRSMDVTAYRRSLTTARVGNETREATIECVAGDYFRVLGVSLQMGQAFGAATGPAVVVSESFRRSLHGDESILGTTVHLGGRPFAVAGVAPKAFSGLQFDAPDLWISLPDAADICTPHGSLEGGQASLRVVGRLRDGYSVRAADDELRAWSLSEHNRADTPESFLRPIASDRLQVAAREARVARWATGAALLVLLITGTNYLGLLSLRAMERRRDTAVRRQLGATRVRVVGGLIAEQMPVVVLASAAAVLVEVWTAGLLRASLPMPTSDAMLHPRTFALLTIVMLSATVPGAILSAVRATRGDLQGALRGDEPTLTGKSQASTALLMLHASLAFTLIAGAGLMMRSVTNLSSEPGYALDELLAVSIDTRDLGYVPQEQVDAWFEALHTNVIEIEGVRGASLTSGDMVRALRDRTMVVVGSGRPLSRDAMVGRLPPELHAVSHEYFETTGTRVLRGRAFSQADTAAAAPVIILDQDQAAFLFGERDPIGQCGYFGGHAQCVEIVGLIEARRHSSLTEVIPEVFIPLAQSSSYRFSYTRPRLLLVRADENVEAIGGTIALTARRTIPEPGVNIKVVPLAELGGDQLRSWRMAAMLFGLFGATGIAMGAIGLYASLAFAVRQRRREIGIRMALGATRRVIVRHICGSAVVAVALGGLAGAVMVTIAARFATWLLFGVAPLDLSTLARTAGILLAVAATGALIPALRAASVDPAKALRQG